MEFSTIIPEKSISFFVKSILVFEEAANIQQTTLPFYADGYPGLIFQETANGLLVSPHNKQMPELFLYGQTIKPIELVMTGSYKIIVFQLFPFVLKSFFNVNPIDLNDNCYNLDLLGENVGRDALAKLKQSTDSKERIDIIAIFLTTLFQTKQNELDLSVALAIRKIVDSNGKQNIGELSSEIFLAERTFERRFLKSVGVTAKQFSKIIQFQQSLDQLTVKDYTKLSDIVYANGFADQSHFIRVFKAFTGKTPSAFISQK